jgi:branched-chain amino acid transport system permease protein
MNGMVRQLLQQMVNLLQLGSIYGLLAIGFSMVYGIAGLVNFAHGMIFMCSTYFLYFFGTLMYHVSEHRWFILIAAFIGASALTSVLAVIVEKAAYKPLRHAPKVSVVVSSVGVGMILEYLVLNFVGPNPHRMPSFVKDIKFEAGGINFSLSIILIVLGAVSAMILLNLFIKTSKIGTALRAVSQDSFAAGLMGISTNFIISAAFVLGAIVATIGAVLYGIAYPTFNPYIGDQINWWSFTAAVIGGIGSIKGAILGGYLLAAVNVFSPMFLPASSWRDVVAFGVLIIVLLIKPTGLLGKNSIQKV